jgi:hypothetical protein
MSVPDAIEALAKAARNYEMGLSTDSEYRSQVLIVMIQLAQVEAEA